MKRSKYKGTVTFLAIVAIIGGFAGNMFILFSALSVAMILSYITE